MTEPEVRPSDAFHMLEKKVVYKGQVITVSVEHVVLPHGFKAHHERLELPRAVAVVPLLEETPGELEVVLVEQFRSSVRGFIHEIPAGIIDEGEEPAHCALRELEEETGYVAGRLRHLATLFPIPGVSGHLMDYFLAEELSEGRQSLDEGECLAVKRFRLKDLVSAILSGGNANGPQLVDCKSYLGVLHTSLLRLPGEKP